MTLEEKLTELALACGYEVMKCGCGCGYPVIVLDEETTEGVPRYDLDRNTLHLVRQQLIGDDVELKVKYLTFLRRAISRETRQAISDYSLIDSDPEYHLEALLKTVGRWRDD